MDVSAMMERSFQKVLEKKNKGEVANYIPEIGNVSPEKLGAYFMDLNQNGYGVGDFEEKFSIQSISKVFALSFVYEHLGEKLWERVDVEPSGNAFNSLVQLETDLGIPRNPFINAGALVLCDVLLSIMENPKREILVYIRDLAQDETILCNEKVAQSEKEHSFRNAAMCNYMKSFGNVHCEPEAVIDLYCYLCAIEMSCKQLSVGFLYLVNSGVHPITQKKILSSTKTKRINAILLTCGFYDESGEFAFRVGLPGKSGVGGGIIALMPNNYAVSVWSPKLNEKGNSYRGMKFLEEFTTATNVSIF